MGISAPWYYSKTNNSSVTPNCHQKLEIIALNPVNLLIFTISTTQLAPLKQRSIILHGNEIRISNLYMAHRKFTTTHEDKIQDQLTLIQ